MTIILDATQRLNPIKRVENAKGRDDTNKQELATQEDGIDEVIGAMDFQA